eukprot:6179483-Pleurochrysis_carterae.AAC.3
MQRLLKCSHTRTPDAVSLGQAAEQTSLYLDGRSQRESTCPAATVQWVQVHSVYLQSYEVTAERRHVTFLSLSWQQEQRLWQRRAVTNVEGAVGNGDDGDSDVGGDAGDGDGDGDGGWVHAPSTASSQLDGEDNKFKVIVLKTNKDYFWPSNQFHKNSIQVLIHGIHSFLF